MTRISIIQSIIIIDLQNHVLAVSLEEAVPTTGLHSEAFIEWCRNISTFVHGIKVEAQFESDSTILVFKPPLPLWVYMKNHPAVTTIGPVKSSNILAAKVMTSKQEMEEGDFS